MVAASPRRTVSSPKPQLRALAPAASLPASSASAGELRPALAAEPSRVLILNDNVEDAESIVAAVHDAFPTAEVRLTRTEADYRSGLAWHPDIVLSDFAMPEFSSLDALLLLQQVNADVPFLIITSTFEEGALTCLRTGATDYLLKDNLHRLGQAMSSAIAQCELRRIAAEAALRQAFQASLLETVGQAVIASDAAGIITYWNRSAEALYGWSVLEAVGRPLLEILPPQTSREDVAAVLAAVMGGDTWTGEFLVQRRGGATFPALMTDTPIRDLAGQVVGIIGVSVDISERKFAEEQYRTLVETMAQGMVYRDAAGQITAANPAAQRMFGLTLAQLQGKAAIDPRWRVVHEDGSPFPEKDHPAIVALRTGHPVRGMPMGIYQPDEDTYLWLLEYATPQFRPGEARPFQVFTTSIDITESRAYQEQLRHQALHDALTGLPNRALFADRIAHALAGIRQADRQLAVLFLDLDRFKVVNDTLGHTLGDILLVQVAQRLQSCMRSADTLVRFGGDEFVVLLEGLERPGEVVRMAERIIANLAAPFTLAGNELSITASIGIAVGGFGSTSADVLLSQADIAMYQAKAAGRGRYVVFDAGSVLGVDRMALEHDLRRALVQNELELHYQPYVNLLTGTTEGVEALLRWQHPSKGWISPGTVIPLAEETGLILSIGAWVREQACKDAAGWQKLRGDDHPLVVAVNLSAHEFDEPGVVDHIKLCLETTGLPAACLRIEITESALMRDVQRAQKTLEELKALGVHLAIDDFGTGYSSLSYLTRFPVDVLKVDQSFVSVLGTNAAADAITRTVTTLAHALDMEVTAEGIETPDQLRLIKSLGCARGQGFLFSRAVPAIEIPALIGPRHYLPQLKSSVIDEEPQARQVVAA